MLHLLINCISAKSPNQIISLKGECISWFFIFLGITLCNSSDNYCFLKLIPVPTPELTYEFFDLNPVCALFLVSSKNCSINSISKSFSEACDITFYEMQDFYDILHSTLSTKVPYSYVISVLNKTIDFGFKGGYEKNYEFSAATDFWCHKSKHFHFFTKKVLAKDSTRPN